MFDKTKVVDTVQQDIVFILKSSLHSIIWKTDKTDKFSFINILPLYICCIEHITFELFAMQYGTGRDKTKNKIPQWRKWFCRNFNKPIVSPESPNQPEWICFFLNVISSITIIIQNLQQLESLKWFDDNSYTFPFNF